MARAKVVYQLMIQGWGDREEEFYECGTYSTLKRAKEEMEKLLQEWEAGGSDRADVVYEIERTAVIV